jgi:hypothetical protein
VTILTKGVYPARSGMPGWGEIVWL